MCFSSTRLWYTHVHTHTTGKSLSQLVKEPSHQRQYFLFKHKTNLTSSLPRCTIHAANWVTQSSVSCRGPWSFLCMCPHYHQVNLENIQPGSPVSIPEYSSYASQEPSTADLRWHPSHFLFWNFIQREQRCARFCVLFLSCSITSARSSYAAATSVLWASVTENCPAGWVGHWAERDGNTHEHMGVSARGSGG